MSVQANVYPIVQRAIRHVRRGLLLVLCAMVAAAALPTAAAHASPNTEPHLGAHAAPNSQAASTATVLVASLRVRTGPGVGFPTVDSALAGESYPVLSQANNCAWLQFQQPDGDVLWFSGAEIYVSLATPCAAIPPFRAEDTPPPPVDYFGRAADTVTVLIPSLRVRTGPGVGFPIIDSALLNERYPVLSQAYNCSWLQVQQPDGDMVWISGAEIYVNYTNGCDSIPVVGSATAEVATNERVDAEPIPLTDPGINDNLMQANIFAPTLGCYFFRNQSFVEVTVTLTLQPISEGLDFRVPAGGEILYCLEPGRYTYTLDAPPPYGSLNGDFEAIEGERAIFPIRTVE